MGRPRFARSLPESLLFARNQPASLPLARFFTGVKASVQSWSTGGLGHRGDGKAGENRPYKGHSASDRANELPTLISGQYRRSVDAEAIGS